MRREGRQAYGNEQGFAAAPESGGWEVRPEREPTDGRFVVQEHHASHLHFDFRLEMGGVLRSWAVPKGPPEQPGIRRLAVAVEDHPVSYINFEGMIPSGQYGAGTVQIWDRGTYVLEDSKPDELLFVLHGERLHGPYALIRMRPHGRNWLLVKREAR
jgi:bifunctional non-homologous end joining protein LigD